jgi:hypothetical protein
MAKIAGSGSESISQRHGSPDPDPHQNVRDPEHCFFVVPVRTYGLNTFRKLVALVTVHLYLHFLSASFFIVCSVADPNTGSGAFLAPGSGMGKKVKIRIQDERPGS